VLVAQTVFGAKTAMLTATDQKQQKNHKKHDINQHHINIYVVDVMVQLAR